MLGITPRSFKDIKSEIRRISKKSLFTTKICALLKESKMAAGTHHPEINAGKQLNWQNVEV